VYTAVPGTCIRECTCCLYMERERGEKRHCATMAPHKRQESDKDQLARMGRQSYKRAQTQVPMQVARLFTNTPNEQAEDDALKAILAEVPSPVLKRLIARCSHGHRKVTVSTMRQPVLTRPKPAKQPNRFTGSNSSVQTMQRAAQQLQEHGAALWRGLPTDALSVGNKQVWNVMRHNECEWCRAHTPRFLCAEPGYNAPAPFPSIQIGHMLNCGMDDSGIFLWALKVGSVYHLPGEKCHKFKPAGVQRYEEVTHIKWSDSCAAAEIQTVPRPPWLGSH
jgi:hypothetical protein